MRSCLHGNTRGKCSDFAHLEDVALLATVQLLTQSAASLCIILAV